MMRIKKNNNSINVFSDLIKYYNTLPKKYKLLDMSIILSAMAVISLSVNFVFLLVLKLSRPLRKSLLDTFYTDLRRAFSPEAMPMYRSV